MLSGMNSMPKPRMAQNQRGRVTTNHIRTDNDPPMVRRPRSQRQDRRVALQQKNKQENRDLYQNSSQWKRG